MRLLIIRHATAVARDTPGMRDEDRPLTPEGEQSFAKAARGLARIVEPPAAILTSPLPRARRTAEIAADAWGGMPSTPCDALAGGGHRDLAEALDRYPEKATVAIVGHEPDLSETLARILGTKQDDRLAFRKGGAALVDLPDGLREGGRLMWFIPPRILRDLA